LSLNSFRWLFCKVNILKNRGPMERILLWNWKVFAQSLNNCLFGETTSEASLNKKWRSEKSRKREEDQTYFKLSYFGICLRRSHSTVKVPIFLRIITAIFWLIEDLSLLPFNLPLLDNCCEVVRGHMNWVINLVLEKYEWIVFAVDDLLEYMSKLIILGSCC
jgi:hypothetical protein